MLNMREKETSSARRRVRESNDLTMPHQNTDWSTLAYISDTFLFHGIMASNGIMASSAIIELYDTI